MLKQKVQFDGHKVSEENTCFLFIFFFFFFAMRSILGGIVLNYPAMGTWFAEGYAANKGLQHTDHTDMYGLTGAG